MSAPLRLFVSIAVPQDSARVLLRAVRKLNLPPTARVRETSISQVHLTVQFIGDTDEHDLPAVIESVERSAAGLPRFELLPTRLATLPQRGPVRHLAAMTDAPPQLMELQRRLASRLARTARGSGNRRFLPHLTLCRFGSSGAPPRLDVPVQTAPFRVEHVLLMRSLLKPSGAEHVEVARAALE
jgi:2'-5' RNA ligase